MDRPQRICTSAASERSCLHVPGRPEESVVCPAARRSLRTVTMHDRAARGRREARGLRRQRHHGPRGPRGGPQTSGHVHRLDRRARPAPPGLGGRRQRRRRGAGRLLRPPSRSTCWTAVVCGFVTTAAASPSTCTRSRSGPPLRWCSPCCTPAASSAAAATRSPAVCTASVSRSSTRCRATRGRGPPRRLRLVAVLPSRRARSARSSRCASPPRDRHHGHLLGRPDIFETTDYSFETLANRFREMAFLNKGLEIVIRDERPTSGRRRGGSVDEVDRRRRGRRSDRVGGRRDPPRPRPRCRARSKNCTFYRYDGGLVDYVEHLNRRKDKANLTVIAFDAELRGTAG